MIGLIQKVLMDLVQEQGGEDAVTAILHAVGLPQDHQFRMDSDYDDGQCLRLVEATAAYFKLDEATLYRLYADAFIRESRIRFPTFYQMAPNARDFLRRQPAVHAGLATALQDADARSRVVDKFAVRDDGNDLLVDYISPNRLCALYRALFERVLDEYGEEGALAVECCRKRGDDCCRFRLTFGRPTLGDADV